MTPVNVAVESNSRRAVWRGLWRECTVRDGVPAMPTRNEPSMNRRYFGRALTSAAGALALARVDAAAFAPVTSRPALRSPLRVNGPRLTATLAELAAFGRNPQGGVSRTAYSEADVQGRTYVMRLMRDAGLQVRIDAAGNIIGRRAGRAGPPLLFGSHIDSVPEGGNYDGNLGSLAAIEVARTLQEQRVTTRHPLEVVVWQNEEGGLVGSRLATGAFPARELDRVAVSGKSIRDGIALLGGDVARLGSAELRRGDVAGYLELHIEQGGTLEREGIDIGVVEGIVGIWQWMVTVEGFANHAGTTPMDQRRDALLAAARFVQMVNRVVRAEPGRQVGTVGQLRAEPGAPNVVPGLVVTSLELRDLDGPRVARLYERIVAEAETIGRESGTTFSFATHTAHEPAPTDPRMRSIVAGAAASLGLTSKVMPSGAGHDAQELARIAPAGMIFVPSVGGISHSPKELTTPENCVNGANVLLAAVVDADRALSGG